MEQHFSAATYSAILIEKITEQSLFGTFEFKYENQNHDHNHDYNHNILFIQVKNLFSKIVVVISRGPVVLYLSSYTCRLITGVKPCRGPCVLLFVHLVYSFIPDLLNKRSK